MFGRQLWRFFFLFVSVSFWLGLVWFGICAGITGNVSLLRFSVVILSPVWFVTQSCSLHGLFHVHGTPLRRNAVYIFYRPSIRHPNHTPPREGGEGAIEIIYFRFRSIFPTFYYHSMPKKDGSINGSDSKLIKNHFFLVIIIGEPTELDVSKKNM